MILVDTNIWIYVRQGEPIVRPTDSPIIEREKLNRAWKARRFGQILRGIPDEQIFITTIIEAELYRHGFYEGKHPVQRKILKPNILPLTKTHERTMLQIAKTYRQRRGGAADFLIAAAAIEYKLALMTNNIADFQTIKGLQLYTEAA